MYFFELGNLFWHFVCFPSIFYIWYEFSHKKTLNTLKDFLISFFFNTCFLTVVSATLPVCHNKHKVFFRKPSLFIKKEGIAQFLEILFYTSLMIHRLAQKHMKSGLKFVEGTGFWKKTKTCWNMCKSVGNRQNQKIITKKKVTQN